MWKYLKDVKTSLINRALSSEGISILVAWYFYLILANV